MIFALSAHAIDRIEFNQFLQAGQTEENQENKQPDHHDGYGNGTMNHLPETTR